MERAETIRTFDEACRRLGREHPLVREYEAYVNGLGELRQEGPTALKIRRNCPSTEAWFQLRIVCAVLNEGWEPDPDRLSRVWWPDWSLVNEDERRHICENFPIERDRFLIIDPDRYGCSSHALYLDGVGSGQGLVVGLPYCLTLKSEDLALLCGTRFIRQWADWLLPRRRT